MKAVVGTPGHSDLLRSSPYRISSTFKQPSFSRTLSREKLKTERTGWSLLNASWGQAGRLPLACGPMKSRGAGLAHSQRRSRQSADRCVGRGAHRVARPRLGCVLGNRPCPPPRWLCGGRSSKYSGSVRGAAVENPSAAKEAQADPIDGGQ